MKQLTIFVNRDLEAQVLEALDHAHVDGFLRLGEASGNRFLAEGQIPRTVAWEAVLFLVPTIEDDKVAQIGAELSAAARGCGSEPCLRIIASTVDVVC